MAEVRGKEADLVCNECGNIMRTVPAGEAEKLLLDMSLEQGLATDRNVPVLPAGDPYPWVQSNDRFYLLPVRTGVFCAVAEVTPASGKFPGRNPALQFDGRGRVW
jgi:hypothetical protein